MKEIRTRSSLAKVREYQSKGQYCTRHKNYTHTEIRYMIYNNYTSLQYIVKTHTDDMCKPPWKDWWPADWNWELYSHTGFVNNSKAKTPCHPDINVAWKCCLEEHARKNHFGTNTGQRWLATIQWGEGHQRISKVRVTTLGWRAAHGLNKGFRLQEPTATNRHQVNRKPEAKSLHPNNVRRNAKDDNLAETWRS